MRRQTGKKSTTGSIGNTINLFNAKSTLGCTAFQNISGLDTNFALIVSFIGPNRLIMIVLRVISN